MDALFVFLVVIAGGVGAWDWQGEHLSRFGWRNSLNSQR